MGEVVTVTSKGQITIPSKLSAMVGVDREIFAGRQPSKEVEKLRLEWDREFEKEIETLTEKEFASQL